MVKVIGPALSLDASGRFGKALQFQRRPGGNSLDRLHYPGSFSPFIPNYKERDKRAIFGLLVAQWQCMSAAVKAQWDVDAKRAGVSGTGYHYFMSIAPTNLYYYHGLCGYWSFNDGPAATVRDLSGRGFTGTLKPTYPGNCPAFVDSINPKLGKALYFDGTDDYVSMAKPISSVSAITVIAKVRFRTFKAYGGIAAQWRSGIYNGFAFRTINAVPQHLYFEVVVYPQGVGNARSVEGSLPLVVNSWYTLMGTWSSGGKVKVSVNGIFDNQSATALTGLIVPSYNGLIGALQWNSAETAPLNPSNAVIDEVRFYNRELSPAEGLKQHQLLL